MKRRLTFYRVTTPLLILLIALVFVLANAGASHAAAPAINMNDRRVWWECIPEP